MEIFHERNRHVAILLGHRGRLRVLQEKHCRLLRNVLRRQSQKTLAHLAIDLVDCGGVCNEKQLLPDVFRGPVCEAIDHRVQDSVPSIVIVGFDLLVLVQSRDYVSGRIEVVQNEWLAASAWKWIRAVCVLSESSRLRST